MAPALIQEVEDDPVPATKVELTEVEETLRRLLLDVAKYIDSDPSNHGNSQVKLPEELASQPITLRFTGGWVRDKLLGVESHDIDVAINKMTGYQFGLRLKEYLEQPDNLAKYGLGDIASNDKQSAKAGVSDKSKTVGGLHKIEANPEKSKHLETTTMRILGLDIDLVNLRKETYSEDSRNPQMEFGTPEEDAMRRDATVNAMFYNVNTQTIEDFTSRGFDDMAAKIIRTPLEPYQTFKDDPLRVLRLIRFASRLGYSIDKEALVAMRDQDIKDALRRKISRERVGVEMEKALRGPDPHEALKLVYSLDLYETIFSDPTVELAKHYKPDCEGWELCIDRLRDVLSEETPLAELLVRDKEERFMAYQLAAMVPYRDAPQPSAPPGRKPPPPVAALVAREGVKATNKVSDTVAIAVKTQEEISNLVDHFNERKRRPGKPFEGDDATARDVLGMAIRRWGTSWRSLVTYSFLIDTVSHPESTEAIERNYTSFLQHLQTISVLDAYSLKPLLDGKALAKALNTPPGPWMKDALDVVMAYQLRNPDTTDTNAAIEAVKEKRGELPSALVRHFLKLTIRPLFQKTKPKNVTEAGRRREGEQLPPKLSMQSTSEEESKPWKSSHQTHALSLLKWIVSALHEQTGLIEEVWHLVIPPILTMIDDWEVKYKTLGAKLSGNILQVTPPILLERTGLDEVIEEALVPCLSYLPSITPEDEAIELLDDVYPALLALSRTRYPKSIPKESRRDAAEIERQRTKYLDMILRKGVFYGSEHCGLQYPRLQSVTFKHAVPVLNEMGIESVKHLKYTLPMLNSILSPSLIAMPPETLCSATKAVQAVIVNGWPRMSEHRGEVLKGITLCWINVEGMSDDATEELKRELKTAVQLLRAALKGQAAFDEETKVLMDADARLKGLFEA
ncbi:poly A polymerase C-terminal region-like protein [Hortaea werneckii]|nr:poly A polymerase C-terminal region-like protein [Hortaea werneckii]